MQYIWKRIYKIFGSGNFINSSGSMSGTHRRGEAVMPISFGNLNYGQSNWIQYICGTVLRLLFECGEPSELKTYQNTNPFNLLTVTTQTRV
jgi:hypothetical protein